MDTEKAAAPAGRARNARGEGRRLRDDLIDAATDLIAEHGAVEAVTIRAVARRAGVSAPSVYLHFADRRALLQAVVEQRFRDLLASIEAATAAIGEDRPADRLRAGSRAYVEYGLAHAGCYRVLFNAPVGRLGPAADAAAADAFASLVDGIAACQAAGVARPGDAYERATATWCAMHGLVSLRTSWPGSSWTSVDELLDDILVGLVGLPPFADSGGGDGSSETPVEGNRPSQRR